MNVWLTPGWGSEMGPQFWFEDLSPTRPQPLNFFQKNPALPAEEVSDFKRDVPHPDRLSASDSGALPSHGAWRENASKMRTVNCNGDVLADDVHAGADEILLTHASTQPLNPRHLVHRRRCGVLGRTGLCGRCADRAIRLQRIAVVAVTPSAKRERAPILNRRPSATCRAGIRLPT